MKQGLEVLWWKHNMIPTKESIQKTSDPPHQSTPHPRPATHLWHTRTHTHPPPLTYFLLQSDWNQSGLVGAADLLMRHRKQLQKCLQAARLQSSMEASFTGICQRKRNQGDPWRTEECQSPAMHGEYPLLAHTFIQTWVGTPQGPPLSGASSIFISADGAPKC